MNKSIASVAEAHAKRREQLKRDRRELLRRGRIHQEAQEARWIWGKTSPGQALLDELHLEREQILDEWLRGRCTHEASVAAHAKVNQINHMIRRLTEPPKEAEDAGDGRGQAD